MGRTGKAQQALVTDSNAFAFDLYHRLTSSGNAIFSPYSIWLALVMTYGGARGTTAQQMAGVLHISQPGDDIHPVLHGLDGSLPRRADNQSFRLAISNALWGQEDYPFRQEYLDLVHTNYGAGFQLADFKRDPEAARQQINAWVEKQTESRIKDLIQPGDVTALTRLILTNAIYFKASWKTQFTRGATKTDTFTLLDGGTVNVPFMNQTETFGYGDSKQMQAISLPYEGNQIAMLIVLPRPGQFEAVEAGLDAGQFQAMMGRIRNRKVALSLPRWKSEFTARLGQTLRDLGMVDAFDPAKADFSGMGQEGAERLLISEAIHKAFIAVDEQGTEAAAATAVIMRTLSGFIVEQPVKMRVDRPFLYAIYDKASGVILFLGRVVNPV